MDGKINTPTFALAFAAKRRSNDRSVKLIKLTPETQQNEEALNSTIVKFFDTELLKSFFIKRFFCFHGVALSDLDLNLITTEHTQGFDIDDFREFSIRHLANQMRKVFSDSYEHEDEDHFSFYSEETLDMSLGNLTPLGYSQENFVFNVFAYSDEGTYQALHFTVIGQPPSYSYQTTEADLPELLKSHPVTQTC